MQKMHSYFNVYGSAPVSTVAREEAERQFVKHIAAQRRMKGRNDDAAPPVKHITGHHASLFPKHPVHF